MNPEHDRSNSSSKPHSKQEIKLGWKDMLAFITAFIEVLLPPFIILFAILIGIYLLLTKLARAGTDLKPVRPGQEIVRTWFHL